MALPREVLESIAADIAEAEKGIIELKDIVGDMRLSGMDTAKEDDRLDKLEDRLRSLKVFYERQKSKAL